MVSAIMSSNFLNFIKEEVIDKFVGIEIERYYNPPSTGMVLFQAFELMKPSLFIEKDNDNPEIVEYYINIYNKVAETSGGSYTVGPYILKSILYNIDKSTYSKIKIGYSRNVRIK